MSDVVDDAGVELLGLSARFAPQVLADAVRMLWPGLLEPSRPDTFPARLTDRDTSQQSAVAHSTGDVAHFKAGSVKALVLKALAEAPQTALDAARKASGTNTPLSTETARKRASELVAAGFAVDTGSRARSAGSPDSAAVLRVTADGLMALTNLRRTGWSK